MNRNLMMRTRASRSCRWRLARKIPYCFGRAVGGATTPDKIRVSVHQSPAFSARHMADPGRFYQVFSAWLRTEFPGILELLRKVYANITGKLSPSEDGRDVRRCTEMYEME